MRLVTSLLALLLACATAAPSSDISAVFWSACPEAGISPTDLNLPHNVSSVTVLIPPLPHPGWLDGATGYTTTDLAIVCGNQTWQGALAIYFHKSPVLRVVDLPGADSETQHPATAGRTEFRFTSLPYPLEEVVLSKNHRVLGIRVRDRCFLYVNPPSGIDATHE